MPLRSLRGPRLLAPHDGRGMKRKLPEVGSRKVMRHFAWLPRVVDGHHLWLERYYSVWCFEKWFNRYTWRWVFDSLEPPEMGGGG